MGNVAKLRARFKEDRAAGVFRDPSKQVKELCEARIAQETGADIDPEALIAIRRYGIFGLPELIRQMKRNNSKHAFAAYLIITGHRYDYAAYICNSNQQFINAEAKLKHVKEWLDGMKRTNKGAETNELVQKISQALAENPARNDLPIGGFDQDTKVLPTR